MCGCYDNNACVKEPTGEIRTRLAPEVRWVTYQVCNKCNHSWSCDDDHVEEIPKPEADIESAQPADEKAAEAKDTEPKDTEPKDTEVRGAPLLPRKVGRQHKAWGGVPRVTRTYTSHGIRTTTKPSVAGRGPYEMN